MNGYVSSENPHTPNLLSPSRPRRIGLLAHGFANWGGGIDFLRLIATSLQLAAPEAELHVLIPTCGPLVQLHNLRNWTRAKLGRTTMDADRPPPIHLEGAFEGTSATLHKIDQGPNSIALASRRLKLEALLPAINPLPAGRTPWVGYIFDFQHKHLPQFFSDHERTERDQAFAQMLNSADAVIVNARDVAKDIDFFYPNRRARVFVMPFSPAASNDAFAVPPEEAIARYEVQKPYFIICNQFWKHKDHGTAFKAFAEVAKRHPKLSLVCTGATTDHRFPDYFTGLMEQVRRDRTYNRIHPLGLIPKVDQLSLLRGAVALVQPTLFEGGPGGGAVYDAVALGTKSIVSDIPVNTEINDSTVSFYKAGDASSLTVAMEVALRTQAASLVSTEPSTLIQLGIKRRRICGKLLFQAVTYVTRADSGL